METVKRHKVKILTGRDWYLNRVGEEFWVSSFGIKPPTIRSVYWVLYSENVAKKLGKYSKIISKDDCEYLGVFDVPKKSPPKSPRKTMKTSTAKMLAFKATIAVQEGIVTDLKSFEKWYEKQNI